MTLVDKKRLLRHKGRAGGDTEPFAMLPVEVLKSEACRTLPHAAHRVLVALAAQYHGANNGSLSLTRKTAKLFGIANTHTLAASLRELESRGLVLQTRPGTRIPPRSALYAVMWRTIDQANVRDSHNATPSLSLSWEWRRWSSTSQGPHWTTKRRAARWRKVTPARGARPLRQSGMSGARPSNGSDSPVAQGHSSHISGVGEA